MRSARSTVPAQASSSSAPAFRQRKVSVTAPPSSTFSSRSSVAKNAPPAPMFSITPSTDAPSCASRAATLALRRVWMRRLASLTGLTGSVSSLCRAHVNLANAAYDGTGGRPAGVLYFEAYPMPHTDCGPFRHALDDAASGTPSPATAEHVSKCADCAKILARQRNLERLLSQWPETPTVDLRPPTLPPHAGGR